MADQAHELELRKPSALRGGERWASPITYPANECRMEGPSVRSHQNISRWPMAPARRGGIGDAVTIAAPGSVTRSCKWQEERRKGIDKDGKVTGTGTGTGAGKEGGQGNGE